MNSKQKMTSAKHHSKGVTLVELMVAITVSSVLIAGIIQIFVSSRQSYTIQNSMGFTQEGGRFSIDVIAQDLRRAGYWGGNAQIRNDVDELLINGNLKVEETSNTNFDDCVPGNTNWARMIDQRVFGINNGKGNYTCYPGSGAGVYLTSASSDVVVARYVTSNPIAVVDQKADAIYMRSSLFEGAIYNGSATASAANKLTDANASDHQLVAHAYYVGTTTEKCRATDTATIPALFRISLNDKGFPQAQKLISGVEDIQIKFGWDADGDGVADRYRDANAFAAAADYTTWNWAGTAAPGTLVNATLWVLMRAECPDPQYTNTKTYELGDKTGVAGYKPNDNYRRQLFTETVSFRN